MPVKFDELPFETVDLLRNATDEYMKVVEKIAALTERKKELVGIIVENGFNDHASGSLNLANGKQIKTSFTSGWKVDQNGLREIMGSLPEHVRNAFKIKYDPDKKKVDALSAQEMAMLKGFVRSEENAPRITIESVPVPELYVEMEESMSPGM